VRTDACARQDPMDTKTLLQLSLTIVLIGSSAVYAVERPTQMDTEGGERVAVFKIGDSRCVLVDDQIICMPVVAK
jgi:serine/threonine protein phosphatase PrpC